MIKFYLRQRNPLFIGLCCAVLLLSACSTMPSPDNSLENRAQARWDAILSNDLSAAYEYLSPGYRSSVSYSQYQRLVSTNQVSWTGAQYRTSECTEKTCKVFISLNYKVLGALPGVKVFEDTSDIEETWLLVDGAWYLVPKS